MQEKNITRGQSNLAEAASNALHTMDSMTITIPLQKLKVGHMTQTRTRILANCCIVFVRAPSSL